MDKQTLKDNFKHNLCYIRAKSGYTQERFAKLLDNSRVNIAAHEEGRAFNIYVIWKLHKVTRLPIEQLLGQRLEQNKTPVTITDVPELK